MYFRVVIDDGFQPLKPFQQIPTLLENLQKQGYKLAFINQSPDNKSMEELLEWFHLNKYLTHKMSMHAPKKELVRMWVVWHSLYFILSSNIISYLLCFSNNLVWGSLHLSFEWDLFCLFYLVFTSVLAAEETTDGSWPSWNI